MKRFKWSMCAVMLLICSVAVALADTPTAWVSVPSTAVLGQGIEIKAGNLSAKAAVTIKIIAPDASVSELYATTDESGNMLSTYVPNFVGTFSVELYGIDGNKIASAGFASGTP